MEENKIINNGLIEMEGMKFYSIEGGFGENQKSMLVKDIATIHNKEVKHINEAINNNRKRFKDYIDIIDFLGVGMNDPEIIEYGFSRQAINSYRGMKSKGLNSGIYLLSERGYSKLLKILEDDFAWEQYEKLTDGYFNMRQVINSDEQLKANLLLNIYKGGQEGILASKQLADLEVKEAVKPLNEKIEEDRPFVSLAKKRLDKNGLISITDANKTFERKRGEITKWAKSEGYLHKTNVEVNNKGEEYFRVYDSKGYRCIGVTEKGLTLIDEHFKSAS